jgi:hypothetical protein
MLFLVNLVLWSWVMPEEQGVPEITQGGGGVEGSLFLEQHPAPSAENLLFFSFCTLRYPVDIWWAFPFSKRPPPALYGGKVLLPNLNSRYT